MSHKTMIDGVAYEISGGKTLIDGTAYKIAKGRTLVDGTGYNVSFAPPVALTVQYESNSAKYYCDWYLDGVNQNDAKGSFEINSASVLKVEVYDSGYDEEEGIGAWMGIYLNGVGVAYGYGTIDYTVDLANVAIVTINFNFDRYYYDDEEYCYGVCHITTTE